MSDVLDPLSELTRPSDPNRDALNNPRVRKFLDRIGKSEGADYNTLVGGSRIDDLSRHPNKVGLRTSAGPSTAFGKYQIVGTTDRSKLAKYRHLDYSPENQDLRAVELLRQTGALEALEKGDEVTAIKRAAKEWASMPGSPLPGRKNYAAFKDSVVQDPLTELTQGTSKPEVDPLTELTQPSEPQFTPQQGRVTPAPRPTRFPRGVTKGTATSRSPGLIAPQFPEGLTTGIATSRDAKLVGRQRTPRVSPATLKQADETMVKEMTTTRSEGTIPRGVDPRLLKGEQPSDPMAYAKAQELVGRTEPQREVGGIRAGATAMGPRSSLLERVTDTVKDYAPGIRNLDTPMGVKTDPIRGAASLGLLDLRRTITPEEQLIDPQAEAKAETAYQIGSFAPAVAPYMAAGKAASLIPALNAATREAHIARTALTFGGVELGRELARSAQTGEPLNPKEVAISTAIGVGIGGLAGVNPSIKRQVVAFITPGVVADVARGTDPETAVSNAFTNLLFGLHSGTAPRPLQARELKSVLERKVNETKPSPTAEAYPSQIRPSVEARQGEVAIDVAAPIGQPRVGGDVADRRIQEQVATEGGAQAGNVRAEIPRHVDLQPRRVRGEGKEQFKAESRAEKETRRQQVEQGGQPEAPTERPIQPLTEPLREPASVSPIEEGVSKGAPSPAPGPATEAQVKAAQSPNGPEPHLTVRRFLASEYKDRILKEIGSDAEALNPTELGGIKASSVSFRKPDGSIVTIADAAFSDSKPTYGDKRDGFVVTRTAPTVSEVAPPRLVEATPRTTPEPKAPAESVDSVTTEDGKQHTLSPKQQREYVELRDEDPRYTTAKRMYEEAEPKDKSTRLAALKDAERWFATRYLNTPEDVLPTGPAIEHNRKQLDSPKFREMRMMESVSGNAGPDRLAVNIAVDKEGRVVAIGNIQDLAPKTQQRMRRGELHRVAAIVRYPDLTIERFAGERVPESVLKVLRKSLEAASTSKGKATVLSPAKAEPIRREVKPLAEAVKPEPSTTSARNEQFAADRAELDLPELPAPARKKWQESLDNAAAKGIPGRASEIAESVLRKPRALTDEESAGLTLRGQQIKNRHAELLKEIEAERDPSVLTAQRAELEALESQFDKISSATKQSGTEAARALSIRRMEINESYDLVSMVSRAKAAKGRDLTPKERARYEQMSGEIENLQTQLAQAQDAVKTKTIQREIDLAKRQAKRSETRQAIDAEFADLRAQFAQAKLETRSGVQGSGLAGLDPEGRLTALVARMAKNRVKAGVVEAEKLIDEVYSVVKEHFDGINREDIRDAVLNYGLADKQNKRRQTQLLKQESELGRRMSEKDYSPVSKREPIVYSRETARLQSRVDRLKADFQRDLYGATRGTSGKIWDTAVAFTNVPKTLKSMGDLSAVFRQGGYFSFTHPVLSSKAATHMIQAISLKGFKNVQEDIKANKDFDLARRSGVEFTGIEKDNPNLSKREEGYLGSDVLDYLPGVKQVKNVSEQTFVSFLDSQRMQVFERFADQLRSQGMTPQRNAKAFNALGRFVNEATGRGSLGAKGNQVAPFLNAFMFSPRLVASRLQILNKMMNPAAMAKMPRGARKIMIRDNVKFAGTIAAFLGLASAAGAKVNWDDPDSADWLKFQVGDTKYDLLAGFQQPMRFMYRMARAVKAQAIGDETYEGEEAAKLALDFARSKASPAGGAAWDALEGKNRLSGEKFSARNQAVDLITPLPFSDFSDAIKNDGVLLGSIKTLPALTGVGVQTYKGSPEPATTKAEKLTRKMIRATMPDDARTAEEIEKSQKVSDLRARSRRGEDVSKELPLMLTRRQEKAITDAKGKTRLQEDFNRLSLRNAIIAYRTMTRGEQESVRPILQEKTTRVDELPEGEQADIRKRLESIGMKLGQVPRGPRPPRITRERRRPVREGYVF